MHFTNFHGHFDPWFGCMKYSLFPSLCVCRAPAGEDWIISFRAWRTLPGSWLSLCTSPTVTRRDSSSANRYGNIFLYATLVWANTKTSRLSKRLISFCRLIPRSVSRPVVGGGGSAGVSTGLASKSPASTTPEETCSAKTWTAAATATNESEPVVEPWSSSKPANQASTLYDCQSGKLWHKCIYIWSGVMDCVVSVFYFKGKLNWRACLGGNLHM